VLLPTSRIEKDKFGIKFYEQDMLVDDHIYTGDMEASVTLKYVTPGFGIALINSEGYSLKDKNEILLFRFGYKEASIIYKNGDQQKTLAVFNTPTVVTPIENLKIQLKKTDNTYQLFANKKQIGSFKVPYELLSYNIGYYSSAENVIKNLNIASSIPYGWIVNMSNTKHGYINFEKNGFYLNSSEGIAEIEQIKIYLTPGTYYLKYEKENINNVFDIKSFITLYNDDNLVDEEKNMLSLADNSFTINFPTHINLKFKGSLGKINKIQITKEKDNDYIATSPDKGEYIDSDGSRIDIKLGELSLVEWTGEVKNVPVGISTNPQNYAIVTDNIKNYGLGDLNISTNSTYSYKFNCDTNKLVVYKNHNIIKEVTLKAKYMLTVFKNISAVITSIKLTTKSGSVIDGIIQTTYKKHVPMSISSPILATDSTGLPLDISSSIRYYYKDNNPNKKMFVFTNIEREYFAPKHVIKLTNIPASITGSIVVYGIKKESTINLDKILEIPNEDMINSIDACANLYDILFEKDLKSVDKDSAQIRLYDVSDYQLIIVDYQKRNSYAINYKYDLGTYEVDISIDDNKQADIIYDNTEKQITTSGKYFINSNEYINTNIKPNESCYIVIGK
jgi:hypothetical protein